MDQDKAQAAIAACKAQLAKAEATVETLRHKLAKLEARAAGKPVTLTGLDLLWKAAVPMARMRSSKLQCRQEWNKIPPIDRPSVPQAIEALKAWNKCEEWRKDANAYVPGLHRWIKNRQWEDLPEIAAERDAAARYRTTPKPIPQTAPEEAATPEEIAQIFAQLTPNRPKK
jgi:multidrug resistance efflux pump